MNAAAWIFAALCALVLIGNLLLGFDVNVPSHYKPAPLNKASYPKIYVHGVTAFAAVLAACNLGVLPWIALLIMAPALVLWEFTQRGTVDPYDITAGALGTLAAVLLSLR